MKRRFAIYAVILVLAAVAGTVFSPKARTQNATVSLGTNGFLCLVPVSTAVTIQAFGGNCVAPGAAVRLYITDIEFGTNASGIAADSFPTLKTGTGGTCGANTSVVWQAFTPAAAQAQVWTNYIVPIRLPLNQELCWINTTAGSKVVQVHGYIGP